MRAVEVLVVVLGHPERARARDRGDEGAAERPLRALPRGLGEPLLRVVDDEDPRAVLVAMIAELPVALGRVDVAPVDLEQARVVDARRIEDHPHRLGVSGAPGGHLLVGRRAHATACRGW